MPELPEVETMRRGLLAVVGRRIVRAELPPCPRKPIAIAPSFSELATSVDGQTIAAIGRLGKRVLIELDNLAVIVIEPRMTGLVLLAQPPTTEHLRLRFVIDDPEHRELMFWDRRGLGTVTLLSADQIEQTLRRRLGPDALAITTEELRANFRHSRRSIKPALLDQKYVAGIGNLYAAEILFLARVDPRVRCDRVSLAQWSRIHAAIGEVLGDAIVHEGSTLSDGTYRNTLNNAGGYQNYHRVYDRAGETCGRCGETAIRRIVQVGRSTFFCPSCQRRR